MNRKFITFNAGPSKITPEISSSYMQVKMVGTVVLTTICLEVSEQIVQDIISYADSGIGILELGHRSSEFLQIVQDCQFHLRNILNIPDNYKILFLQGGASGQFDAIPMNLFGNLKLRDRKADYLITGSWSLKAAKEASKYGKINQIYLNNNDSKFTALPKLETYEYDPDVAYFYYCANETINGLEFHYIPQIPSNIPIVCDMCSNFMSRPIDIQKYGIIFASSQKNLGCAGITVLIVREDLIGHELDITPSILNYRIQSNANSIYNTPPTFTLYVVNENLKWIKKQGGLNRMEELSIIKSQMIYELIDVSNGFYNCPAIKQDRSRMNIVFTLPNKQLETEFLNEAKICGFIGLKGHRSIGGLRISIYNSITIEDVTNLVEFMRRFMIKYINCLHS